MQLDTPGSVNISADISIIIVNWNTKDLLHRCLTSIDLAAGSLSVQTIVVDNKSADGSGSMVSTCFPRVVLIQSGGNLGFARANNLGLPHATAPLVLFLNPDTEVNEQALARMVEFMRENPPVGALGCKIRDLSGAVQQLGLQWFPSPFTELLKFLVVSDWTYARFPRLFPYHDPLTSGYVAKLFGACLLVRRSVLEQAGSFDERFFMYCEDVDLCYRIAKAGWKLFYLSDAEILHLGAGASANAPGAFSVLMSCESFAKFMRKHYGRIGGPTYRCVAFAGAQIRLLMLMGMRLAIVMGWRGSATTLRGAIRKYITIAKWALGLQKPVIRDQ